MKAQGIVIILLIVAVWYFATHADALLHMAGLK